MFMKDSSRERRTLPSQTRRVTPPSYTTHNFINNYLDSSIRPVVSAAIPYSNPPLGWPVRWQTQHSLWARSLQPIPSRSSQVRMPCNLCRHGPARSGCSGRPDAQEHDMSSLKKEASQQTLSNSNKPAHTGNDGMTEGYMRQGTL